MPALRKYVEIGICAGYGDGDYQVSATVADLSREDMQELRLAFVCALYATEDMWRKAREKDSDNQAKQANHGDDYVESLHDLARAHRAGLKPDNTADLLDSIAKRLSARERKPHRTEQWYDDHDPYDLSKRKE